MRSVLRFILVATVFFSFSGLLNQASAEEVAPFGTPFNLAKYQAKLKEYYEFVTKKMIGKSLITVVEHPGSKRHPARVSYKRTLTFKNPKKTATGLSFDTLEEVYHRTFPFDEAGKEMEEINNDRTFTKRYELGLRKSSGAMLGFARYETDKKGDLTGEAYQVEATLVDGELTLDDALLMYADLPIDAGKFLTTSTSSTTVLYSENGKLKMEQTLTEFDVDEATFDRVPRNPDEKGEPIPSVTVISEEKAK